MSALVGRFFNGERRRAPRVAGDLSVAIYPGDLSDPIQGVARDLSMVGICVATRTTFADARLLRIGLHAPTKAISLEVQRLWQQYESGEKVVLTGFAFATLNEVERETIAELLSASIQRISGFLGNSRLPELGLADVMGIAEVVRFRTFHSGHVIYGCPAQEHRASSLYIVEEGRVSLHLASAESRNISIAQTQAGDLFGGIDASRGASLREVAIAEGDAHLFEIDRSGFDYLRRHRPKLALELATAAFHAASVRLCAALLESAGPREVGPAAKASAKENPLV